MIRRWYVGFNDYWFTSSIFLEEMPLGFYIIEWIVNNICWVIPCIKLPKIKFKLKNKDDWDFTDNNDGWTDLYSYYGDLSQLCYVFMLIPLQDFIYKHINVKSIDLPFNFMLEEFPNEYPNELFFNDFENDQIKKHREISNNIDKEFRKIYSKLKYNYLKEKEN